MQKRSGRSNNYAQFATEVDSGGDGNNSGQSCNGLSSTNALRWNADFIFILFCFVVDNNKLTAGNSKQRASNIAQKAAQEAKAASDAQQV